MSGTGIRRTFSLVLLFFVGIASAQQARTYRVPFHAANGIILLEVEVNDKPAVLVLDTGSRFSAVSQQISGLTVRGEVLELRPGEATHGQAERVTAKLRLGDFRVVKPFLAVNLDTVQRQMGARFDGILSEDVLHEFTTVRIDFKGQTVDFEK